MNPPTNLAEWLKGKCQEEALSLRQAAIKTDLSHATIGDLLKGKCPSRETIKKLAHAFSGNGHYRLVLQDELLTLAGYRTQRPGEDGLSEPLAQLLDKVSAFGEPELRMISHFADYIVQTRGK
ncbi:hypothetical protein ES703_108946 [subsurface metagenome]